MLAALDNDDDPLAFAALHDDTHPLLPHAFAAFDNNDHLLTFADLDNNNHYFHHHREVGTWQRHPSPAPAGELNWVSL
jgi:hypothetical protein